MGPGVEHRDEPIAAVHSQTALGAESMDVSHQGATANAAAAAAATETADADAVFVAAVSPTAPNHVDGVISTGPPVDDDGDSQLHNGTLAATTGSASAPTVTTATIAMTPSMTRVAVMREPATIPTDDEPFGMGFGRGFTRKGQRIPGAPPNVPAKTTANTVSISPPSIDNIEIAAGGGGDTGGVAISGWFVDSSNTFVFCTLFQPIYSLS